MIGGGVCTLGGSTCAMAPYVCACVRVCAPCVHLYALRVDVGRLAGGCVMRVGGLGTYSCVMSGEGGATWIGTRLAPVRGMCVCQHIYVMM